MRSLRELYIRSAVQTVGAIAVIVGGIGWITGWRYGHGLVTLGLAVYLCSAVTGRMGKGWHTVSAFHDGKQAANSYREGRFEDAAEHIANQVGHVRQLAFIDPGETRYAGRTLIAQWTVLTKLGRHEDALVVAEEAVAVCRIADAGRPQLVRALELVEWSLSEFPDRPVGPETDELLRLRAERADEANRLQARALTMVAERHVERREHAAARPLLEQAARIHRHLGPGSSLVVALNDLGNCLSLLDEHEQARASYAEGLAVAGTLDRADPDDVFGLQVNLAGSLRHLERYAEAVPLGYAVVAKLRADHQSEDRHEKSLLRLGWALTSLIDDLRALGRDDEARVLDDELSALTPESDSS
jgi:tetratricopeptide (TPR) repeat protein